MMNIHNNKKVLIFINTYFQKFKLKTFTDGEGGET